MFTALIVAAVLSAVVGIGSAIATNVNNSNNVADTNAANLQATQETNQSNLQIARETNAANAEQANLAYQRSRPINQLFDMMQAGISKSAALSKIAGGGTYSPAQMVGATMQSPHFEGFQAANIAPELSSMIRSLGDIPANAMQQESIQTNLEKTRQELEFARAEEIRRQQAHDLDMDEKLYSKWERESMDNFMSKIENASQSKNVQPKENQSLHEYIRELGLQDDPDYQKLPASARQRAFDHYKQVQDEKRAQIKQEQESEAHSAALISSNLNNEQAKLRIKQLRNEISDWNDTKNARSKETKLREVKATLETLMTEAGLPAAEREKAIQYARAKYLNEESDYDIIAQLGQTVDVFDAFWQGLFKMIPLNALSKTLLSDIIKIGI